jgi:hypothetical protein
LTVDNDGQIYPGSPDAIAPGTSATVTYAAAANRPVSLFGNKASMLYVSTYATPLSPTFARNGGTYVYSNNTGPPGNPFHQGYVNAPVIKNDPGTVQDMGGVAATVYGFRDQATVQVDTATGRNFGFVRSFYSAPVINTTGSGTWTNGSVFCFATAPTVATGANASTVAHFTASNMTLGGTVATQVGFDVALLSGATVNIGVRNASIEVDTPTVATITAVGNTITHTSKLVTLNNTSGSSKTLTSTPTITAGQDGELLTLINTSANDVVIQDNGTLVGSTLRLAAASRTLSTRDSIRLLWNATIGGWCEVAFTNVL